MRHRIEFMSEGRQVAAAAIRVPNTKHNAFHVRTEDGYENIFFTDVETGKWVEEDLGFTDLAATAGSQLQHLLLNKIHVPKILSWRKLGVGNKSRRIGYFQFMKNEFRMFEIYGSNRKYLFTLAEMENEEWYIVGTSQQRVFQFDPFILYEIVKTLPAS